MLWDLSISEPLAIFLALHASFPGSIHELSGYPCQCLYK